MWLHRHHALLAGVLLLLLSSCLPLSRAADASTADQTFSQGLVCFNTPSSLSDPTLEVNDLMAYYSGMEGKAITTVVKVFSQDKMVNALRGCLTLANISPYCGSDIYGLGIKSSVCLNGCSTDPKQDNCTYQHLKEAKFALDYNHDENVFNLTTLEEAFKGSSNTQVDLLCEASFEIPAAGPGEENSGKRLHCPIPLSRTSESICIYSKQFIAPPDDDLGRMVLKGNITTNNAAGPQSDKNKFSQNTVLEPSQLSTYLSKKVGFYYSVSSYAADKELARLTPFF